MAEKIKENHWTKKSDEEIQKIINKINKVKIYNNGLLSDQISSYHSVGHRSTYLNRLGKTYSYLQKRNILNPISYELHVPMPMEKSKLINVLGEKYTILWRSAYGNRYKVGGEEIRDVKIYKRGPLLPISYNKEDHDLPYLSNADNSFDLIKDFLIANFPDKSIYEK